MRLEQVVQRQLSRVGIAARHAKDFMGDSARWSPTRWQDFLKRQDVARMTGGPGAQILSVLPPSVLSMPDFNAFQNELAGYNEVVRWPLYSYKAYATTGHTQLTFFDQTEGTATLGRADTNMQAAGTLPGAQMHVAHSIRVVPIPAFADVAVVGVASGVAFGEWYRVLSNGCWAECTVSDKLYLVAAPLFLLPQGMGPGSWHQTPGIALANTISIVNNGLPSNEAIYRLDPPLGILPTRTFSVTLNWRAVQAVTTAGRIGAILDGWRLRAVQ
jgi:hypothetical protein